ncbi:uncharacterized protein EDB91DRAFT_289954 [Suillus paluster]|uniref:uncharacterized protein n=1 Tax=Suillus paluster TaxID=48578 RepID=UPI001B86EC88|nr:uncharacterized protein EDB91DRAFT_289954 [Suillus paluster]KAG1742665.1 hypothetical protein EDB91DRAFT_289954 [Suillus paluster]
MLLSTILPYPSQHYLPQPDNVSAGQKRVAEDLGDDKASKKSKLPKKISKDPEFVQLPDENGRRVIKCLRCDEKMNSTSYGKHIQTLKHRGLTEGEFICGCGHPYSRIDALERHWKDSPCGKKRKMCKRPSSSIPSQGSTSSASASPAAVPHRPFHLPRSCSRRVNVQWLDDIQRRRVRAHLAPGYAIAGNDHSRGSLTVRPC